MGTWYSPFPVDPTVQQRLESIGLLNVHSHHTDDVDASSSSVSLILYDTPHQLLAMESETLTVDTIISGYREVLRLASSRYLAIAVFRLNALSNDAILLCSSEREPSCIDDSPPAPTSLEALLARSVLEVCPDLLNAYLDIEMSASLFGGSPDSNYLVRLYECLESQSPNQLLADWHAAHSSSLARKAYLKDLEQKLLESQHLSTEKELQLSSLSGEINSVQTELHRVQEELEHYFLENESLKQKLLQLSDTQNSAEHQITSLTESIQQLQEKLTSTEHALDEKSSEVSNQTHVIQSYQAEAESQQHDLHQVQEELEHYFLENKNYQMLSEEIKLQLLRAEALLLADDLDAPAPREHT